MDRLKVCFIGVGSIARRHINNLSKICRSRKIELQVDSFSNSGVKAGCIHHVYRANEKLPNDYDVIFITNPTSEHMRTLRRFHKNGNHFFIEKPIVSIDKTVEAYEFKLRDTSVYYVACPLRYSSVIQYIKEKIDPEDVISIRCIASSYLPDWRPDQDYRKSYSANKDLGGGVSIDLIHEWDYITYLFGFPKKIFYMTGKKSSLDINSDDYAIYIAEYDGMIAELHLDYFGRKTIREIELFTKEDTIIGDLAGNKVRFLKSGKEVRFDEERDDYQTRELEYFIDQIMEPEKTKDYFHHALKVMKLTQGIVI